MPVDIIVGNKVVQRLGYDETEREVECPACGHSFLARDDARTKRIRRGG